MLDLKTVSKDGDNLKVVYTVRHNTEEFNTVLTQDLTLTIDARTGAIQGSMLVDELKAPNLDEGIEKLAVWCDRLAAALREPRITVTSVPIFERDYS